MMGAWPVMGFFGLDALLIYVAFKLNYRAGRLIGNRRDHARPTCTVTRTTRTAAARSWRSTRIGRASTSPSARTAPTRCILRSHGTVHAVGTFLTDDERRDLAGALGRALADVPRALISPKKATTS